MSRIVYVNGAYLPEAQASVSVFDRGFLFADGVYEVTTILNGALIDNEAHLVRLKRSLSELSLEAPCSMQEIESIQHELVRRNEVTEGVIYLQVTRGAAERDFKFPKQAKPTLVMFTQHKNLLDDPVAARGISVITVPDLRWKRRDIKTIGLLWPCMAKQQAVLQGADDAWLVEDGTVNEGSSNNAFILNSEGILVTRHLGSEILHGITRRAVLALSQEESIMVEERSFTVAEALAAREAFITSASTFVHPVISIDGHAIGEGVPGEVSKRLRHKYIETALMAARG